MGWEIPVEFSRTIPNKANKKKKNAKALVLSSWINLNGTHDSEVFLDS